MLLPNGVPVVPFKAPRSKTLAGVIQKKIVNCNALILENHGIVTVGSTIEEACSLNKMVEEGARIQLLVMMLAGRDAVNLAERRKSSKRRMLYYNRKMRDTNES
jgi:ribulose-5-phosphate 4-epimerase/fuculose-1-phosphate aldolase